MKRLYKKNLVYRKKYNCIKTKISFSTISFLKLYNICLFSYYGKNINHQFHISNKFLKIFFQQGYIYGYKKYSF
jgi:hypothetical protein